MIAPGDSTTNSTAPTAARTTRAAGTISGRLAALAGVVSFVLILLSAMLRGDAPSATDSAQNIFSYLALHHGQRQLRAVFAALAMSTALVRAAGLYRALASAVIRRADGRGSGAAFTGVLAKCRLSHDWAGDGKPNDQ